MNSNILFSDVDNTLIHKEHSNVKIPSENRYISEESINILHQILKEVPIVLITGRRITGYERLKSIPHNFGIIEHGCIVLRKNKIDKRYAKEFKKYIGKPWKNKKIGLLWDYEKELQNKGFIIDSKDRYASFRIDPKVNNLGILGIQKVLRLNNPHGIKIVRNGTFIDFIPPMGGKSHAINYILHRKHLRWSQVFAFGDDYNDFEMLNSAEHPYSLGNAIHPIKSLVSKKKGYISPESSHKGTEDSLRRILFSIK